MLTNKMLCGDAMNRRYAVFDFVVMVGFVLIVVALGLFFVLQAADTFEVLVTLGLWVIFSFFITALVHGVARGIPRTEVKVPKGFALLAFSISGTLFLSAWVISGT